MAKKHNKFQKKRKYKYIFIFWLVGIGICLILISMYTNSIKIVEGNPISRSKGTTSENKSFQPSNPKKNFPSKLLWGRDF